MNGGNGGTSQPDFFLKPVTTFCRARTNHYIGRCRPNWAVEMAVYSLTGNARSPFHAEPTQLRQLGLQFASLETFLERAIFGASIIRYAFRAWRRQSGPAAFTRGR